MEEEYRPLKPKQAVADDGSGKRISHISFGTFSREEIARSSEFEVITNKGYEQPSRIPIVGGVLDRRLGVSDKQSTCETCGAKLQDCPGHYGHIKLALPVFHIGYFKSLIAILQCVCKTCSRVLLPADKRLRTLKQLNHPLNVNDYMRRTAAMKKVVDICKKERECPYCQAFNGIVKRVGSMKIIHEKYKEKDKSDRAAASRYEFHQSFSLASQASKGAFEDAKQSGADLAALLSKAQDDLNPLRVRAILQAIPECDLPLLDMDATIGRPENLIVDYLLVPPVAIRPSVVTDGLGSTEDDLTVKLSEIVGVNNIIRNAMTGFACPSFA